MSNRSVFGLFLLCASLGLAACQMPQQTPPVVLSTKSAVELRSMQSRAFDTTDRLKTLRTVIATLQDLGYKIDKVEPQAGTVSATKLALLRLTATVYPHGASQLAVRANALVKLRNGDTQVDDPSFYQKLFFEPLAKAMFLTALNVEGADDVAPAQGANGDGEVGAAGAPKSLVSEKKTGGSQ